MIIADDYGISFDNDLVIVDLLNQEKIDGTSILINHIDQSSIELIKNRKKGTIGLHLEIDISPINSIFILKKHKKILKECMFHQINAFKKIFGEHPEFIDGHRHVHTYFNLQEIFIRTLTEIKFVGSVRVPAEDITIKNLISLYKRGSFMKGFFVTFLSLVLAKKLKRNNIKHNENFIGFYNLADTKNSKKSFYEILSLYRDSYLLMVHPGKEKEEDDIYHLSKNRKIETDILMDLER